jgi:3-hydroxybutyryl-CoA dehydratase
LIRSYFGLTALRKRHTGYGLFIFLFKAASFRRDQIVLGFVEGQEHSMALHISQQDVEKFADLSGDKAPLHTDTDFARSHGFSGTLIHGALLAAGVSRLIGMELPGRNAILERMDMSFRKPLYAPADLKITGRVRHISEAVRSLTLDITIEDDAGTVAVTGKTWHRILATASE